MFRVFSVLLHTRPASTVMWSAADSTVGNPVMVVPPFVSKKTPPTSGKRRAVRARVADPQEHERLWPRFVAAFPSYDFYRRQAAPRGIPLVLLEPLSGPTR